MAKVKFLVDTDIFINYMNLGSQRTLFHGKGFEIYYSIITKKELLSKPGLKDSERRAILSVLKRYRIIPLNRQITDVYSDLRRNYPFLEKEDTLIAATALVWDLPIITQNWKHYKVVEGLKIFSGIGL